MDKTMNKVAQLTAYFWVMKICTTTLGETAVDLLSMTMNVGYAISSIILIGFFLGTLVIQLATKKLHPVLYWFVILTTSTAGTTVSDYIDRTLGLGYATGALLLILCLLVILGVWRYSKRPLLLTTSALQKLRYSTGQLYWCPIH